VIFNIPYSLHNNHLGKTVANGFLFFCNRMNIVRSLAARARYRQTDAWTDGNCKKTISIAAHLRHNARLKEKK